MADVDAALRGAMGGLIMNKDVQLLIFHLDSRQFCLRLSQVDRVVQSVDYTPLPRAPQIVLGIIDVAGQVLPLLNTRRRFGFAERPIDLDDQFIIARTSRRLVVLVVDGVNGVVTRPASDLVATGGIVPGLDHQVEGVLQLEDGLVLLHDLDQFASLEEERALEQALAVQPDTDGN